MSKPLVYVAGPYTRPDPVQNTHKVIQFASELVDDGLVVPFVPHLTLLFDIIAPRPVEFWYEYDFSFLERCDALYRYPGESTGADNEEAFAVDHGIPCFYDKVDLYAWVKENF